MTSPYQGLLDCQRENFLMDVTKTRAWRLDQPDRIARMLTEQEEAWKAALHTDFGKPPFEQMFEITVPLGNVTYYCEHLDDLMTPEEVSLSEGCKNAGHRGVIHKKPFGVTRVIGPFNAPILLLPDPAIAALAAGNPVILKPANTAPANAALFAELVPQYFEPENVAVVTGGRQEISVLLDLPFDFIFFTGSSTVGKVVMRAAAQHLAPVILELGGQNPTVADRTANLRVSADRIAWGHNAISGQWCIAPGYVYVHAAVADAFLSELKAALTRMCGENPIQSPDFARMISEKDTKLVASYILPEKIVHGGGFDIEQRFIDPTVLYPSTWDDTALQQEVFGPVLPVLPYSDLGEVIDV
ncbi:MAG: aldehyde dehydrogenase family protein, partial [Pseudomonadota bacterium]